MTNSYQNIDPQTHVFAKGDHVAVYYTPSQETPFWFWHHGICVGYEDNIPYFISLSRKGLRKETLEEFSENHERMRLYSHDFKKFSRDEVVMRAYGCLLNAQNPDYKYDLLSNNCEHFVNYIIEDNKKSSQVRHTLGATAVGLATLGIVGAGIISTINKNRHKNI